MKMPLFWEKVSYMFESFVGTKSTVCNVPKEIQFGSIAEIRRTGYHQDWKFIFRVNHILKYFSDIPVKRKANMFDM